MSYEQTFNDVYFEGSHRWVTSPIPKAASQIGVSVKCPIYPPSPNLQMSGCSGAKLSAGKCTSFSLRFATSSSLRAGKARYSRV